MRAPIETAIPAILPSLASHSWAPTEEEWRERIAEVRAGWGERGYFENLAREWAPEVAANEGFLDWFVWHGARSHQVAPIDGTRPTPSLPASGP